MTYTAIPLPCPYATLCGVYGTGHDAIAILPPVDAVLLRDRLNEEEKMHEDRTPDIPIERWRGAHPWMRLEELPMIESTAEAMGEHVLLGKPTDADKLARVREECKTMMVEHPYSPKMTPIAIFDRGVQLMAIHAIAIIDEEETK